MELCYAWNFIHHVCCSQTVKKKLRGCGSNTEQRRPEIIPAVNGRAWDGRESSSIVLIFQLSCQTLKARTQNHIIKRQKDRQRGEPACVSNAPMMVNFLYQLDQATGYPDIWWNIILGVSVFLDEINICISRLSKQIALPNVGGPHPTHWRPELNKRLRKGEFTLCLSSSWDIGLVLLLHLDSD